MPVDIKREQQMAKYLSCAETAKLVRQALKEAFSGTKFSVQSKVYSGGASISVRYTDGPNSRQVEAITGRFSGAYFDGMTDYKGSTRSMIDGEEVSFGADFIFVTRDYSDAMIQKGIDSVARNFAGNFSALNIPAPTVEQFKKGELYNVQVMESAPHGYDLQRLIHKALSKMTDRFVVKSKAAAKVIYLGNDGYSDMGALDAGLLNEVAA